MLPPGFRRVPHVCLEFLPRAREGYAPGSLGEPDASQHAHDDFGRYTGHRFRAPRRHQAIHGSTPRLPGERDVEVCALYVVEPCRPVSECRTAVHDESVGRETRVPEGLLDSLLFKVSLPSDDVHVDARRLHPILIEAGVLRDRRQIIADDK